jgi:methylmalonyl-CoA mutase
MTEDNVQQLLQKSFAKPTRQDWMNAASAEVDNADPFQALQWKGLDEVSFFPYYDKADVAHLHYLTKFNFPLSHNFLTGYRAWKNLASVSATENANTIALSHLTNGADGILFDIKGENSISVDELLRSIEWPYCTLSFHATQLGNFIPFLTQYISHHYKNLELLTGTIFWDVFPKKDAVNFFIERCINFQSLGVVIRASSPVKEISEALQAGVKLIDSMADDRSIESVIKSIAFSMPVGSKFLEDISKLKALRLLWFQITQAYGVKNYSPHDLHLHARSEYLGNEKYQPHANVLKSTTAAMASIAGGCNSITVYPENENNTMMNRMARNISTILREESHIDKVADPVAGSYVIDAMVDKIAQAAWSNFQSTLCTK